MKVIRKIKIEGKNWNDIFSLPCVDGLHKEDIIQDGKMVKRIFAAVWTFDEEGETYLDVAYEGDTLCELDNHKWFIQVGGAKEVEFPAYGIPVKICLNGGIMPKKASDLSAGYDLFCPEDTPISFGRQIIPLKFGMQMQEDMKADIRPRSGHSSKGFKAMLHNDIDGSDTEVRIDADVKLGTIDADYRDGVGVILVCRDKRVTNGRYHVPKGWSIAQMVFSKVPTTYLQPVDELDRTIDRGGGYGHSDEGKQ